ncbi:sulfite exporter TauE/SafE family protein [Virgibacillus ainsalahensis]
MFIGLLTAFTGSLVGLGGGIVLVPSLLILNQYVEAFAWATPQVIVGISLTAMVFTALSSTVAYHSKGRIDYKIGTLFLSGSIPGGIFGAWLNQFVDTDNFLVYFGCVMILISLLFFIKRKTPVKLDSGTDKTMWTFHLEGKTNHYIFSIWPAFFISLIVGTLSGLFGIGGGSIMVPAMILLFGFPVHIATATSMFMILIVSIVGASTHITLGHIPWEYVFYFIPGAWVGGKLGALVNQKLNGKILEWILRILLIFIGIRMIFQGLS